MMKATGTKVVQPEYALRRMISYSFYNAVIVIKFQGWVLSLGGLGCHVVFWRFCWTLELSFLVVEEVIFCWIRIISINFSSSDISWIVCVLLGVMLWKFLNGYVIVRWVLPSFFMFIFSNCLTRLQESFGNTLIFSFPYPLTWSEALSSVVQNKDRLSRKLSYTKDGFKETWGNITCFLGGRLSTFVFLCCFYYV